MHCPSNIILNSRFLWIEIHTDGDFNGFTEVPARQRINPLRYQIGIGPNLPIKGTPSVRRLIILNKNGRWNIAWSNFRWKYLGGKKRWEKKNPPIKIYDRTRH